jgi:hypothetical protein
MREHILWGIPVRSSNQTVPNAYTSEALKQAKRLGNVNNRKIRINFLRQLLSSVINTPNKDLDRVTKNYFYQGFTLLTQQQSRLKNKQV